MLGPQPSDVYVSTVLPTTIDRAWRVIRDFNDLPTWHPMISSSQIEEGLSGDTVGAVRDFTLHDGARIREQLLALSDADWSITYSILDAPIPVEDYRATLRLRPVTEGQQTFAEWFATFRSPSETRTDTVQLVRGIFTAGLAGLNSILEKEPSQLRSSEVSS